MITHRVKVRPWSRSPDYWAECQVLQTLEEVVHDIAEGQYERPIEVEAYHEQTRTGHDVSNRVAGLVVFRLTSQGRTACRSTLDFLKRHLGDSDIEDVVRSAA